MSNGKNELLSKRNMHDIAHCIIIHNLLNQTDEEKEIGCFCSFQNDKIRQFEYICSVQREKS